MGKFPESSIHGMYSKWHWELISKDIKYKKCYVSDIDRIWIEYDFNSETIVGVIDIKWEGSGDTKSPTEKGIYDWFRKQKVEVYIVYITKDFSRFRVVNTKGDNYILSEIEYANWLYNLHTNRNSDYLNRYKQNVATQNNAVNFKYEAILEPPF